ncbi:MAG: hypothetical protein MR877_03065 [Spirochaetia bacterium]|nr:hypothetical protein [Spirochaetia bacterium]
MGQPLRIIEKTAQARFIERATRDANKTKKMEGIKMKSVVVFLADGFEDA